MQGVSLHVTVLWRTKHKDAMLVISQGGHHERIDFMSIIGREQVRLGIALDLAGDGFFRGLI